MLARFLMLMLSVATPLVAAAQLGDDPVMDAVLTYAAANAAPPGTVVYQSFGQIFWYGGPGIKGWALKGGEPCKPAGPERLLTTASSRRDVILACAAEAWSQARALSTNAPDNRSCFAYTSRVRDVTCGTSTVTACEVKVYQSSRPASSYTPAFLVQSIYYALPGNRSRITYLEESTRGSTWQTTTTTDNTLTLQLEDKLTAGGTIFQVKQTDTDKITVSDTSSWTDTEVAHADLADHTQDTFVLWINPVVTRYGMCPGSTGMDVTSGAFPGRADPAAYYMVGYRYPDFYLYSAEYKPWVLPGLDPNGAEFDTFTVAELLDPASAKTDEHRKFLERFTPAEIYENALKLDPFVSPDGTINRYPDLSSPRFRPVQNGAGACPAAFAGISLARWAECKTKFSYGEDKASNTELNWTVSVPLVLGPFGKSNDTLKFSYSRSVTQSTSDTHTATLHLETATSNVCIDGQLRFDTMFNTYLVASYTHKC